ncbi:MAG: hypothetical protein Q7U68_00860, partial [Candidatus Roizmanbacteria bacterium]|nr:hypothetical protein [Candidatus Roizmanbacteria bacterium]
RAKNSANSGAYGRRPYENKFIQVDPRLLEIEQDYFFKLLAAKELGIDSRIPRLGATDLPKNLTPEQQKVYDNQIQLVKGHYETTQAHLKATASNRTNLKPTPSK